MNEMNNMIIWRMLVLLSSSFLNQVSHSKGYSRKKKLGKNIQL